MTGSILGLIACLIASAFFSATETAFTSLTPLQIQEMRTSKGKRGRNIAKLAERPDILLGTVLIGNNIANIGASAIVTEFSISLWGDSSVGIAAGVLTFVILIFGEVTPKRIAIVWNEKIALTTSRLLILISWIFRPFIKLVNFASSIVTGIAGTRKREPVTIDSMLGMVKLAENLGILDLYKGRVVKNVLRLSDATVQAIMTHRMRVFSLESSTSLEEALRVIAKRGFSKIPVFSGHSENIVGVASVRTVLDELLHGEKGKILGDLMIEPIFVLPTKPAPELFGEFKRRGENFAVVIDEYGGLAGIVTMRDLIEEILGEFRDEDSGGEKITHIEGRMYAVSGDTPIYALQEVAGTEIPHSPYVQTVAGYIAEILGRIPASGEEAHTPAGKFLVTEVRGNRVVSAKYELNLISEE